MKNSFVNIKSEVCMKTNTKKNMLKRKNYLTTFIIFIA